VVKVSGQLTHNWCGDGSTCGPRYTTDSDERVVSCINGTASTALATPRRLVGVCATQNLATCSARCTLSSVAVCRSAQTATGQNKAVKQATMHNTGAARRPRAAILHSPSTRVALRGLRLVNPRTAPCVSCNYFQNYDACRRELTDTARFRNTRACPWCLSLFPAACPTHTRGSGTLGVLYCLQRLLVGPPPLSFW